jgi:sigma-B regulation protein RsbU (phosphoserine phosphatase)
MMKLTLVGMIENREVRFPLAEGVHLVGRGDDAAIRLAQPSISRRHAEITVREGAATVCDLGSHNGTMVNGARITAPVALGPGDVVEVANLGFRIEGDGPLAGSSALGPVTSAEISWDEVRSVGDRGRNLQSLLFRVLAKAGDLLTIPRSPAAMYEPILDLVDTALLHPERIFVLLLEEGREEPVQAASRIHGRGGDALILGRTMTRQVISEKKSVLTSGALDGGDDAMMSMVSQGIRSAIAVPLFDNEDVIGILYADDTRPGRTFIKDQLAAFTLLANTIAVALTHARYHEMEEQKRHQDAELATAGEILDHLLPASLPALDGYDVLASLEPCYELGGDLYDGRFLPDGRYAFLIGDVTGKGLGAALLVSHVLSLARFMMDEGWEPEPLVTRLNAQIFACTDHVRFTTLFVGCLEPDTGRVTYVNAGHNPPYVVRADGAVEECPSTGLPVGMIEGIPYGSGAFTLERGDLVALYSDGIPETQRVDDEQYGEERFKELLVQQRSGGLPDLFARLQAELAEFRGAAAIGDDVTLVTVRRS